MAQKPDKAPELSEQRFALLVNAVTDYAIYMLDPQGIVISWNAGARRFKGYEADEIVGLSFSRFFTAEDREAGVPQHALDIAASVGRFESEGWRVRKDGTRFWASAVLDAIRDDSGQLLGFAKITRDVTERRETERALFESERQFRRLVQGVRDYAIYMLDPDGRVSNWNAGAELIKGYAAEEIVGDHFSRFYTVEDRAAGEPARALATALDTGKYEAEAWRVRKDGTRFFAHVVIDPIRDEAGRHIGFAKITRDITERRQAQQALTESRESLFQAQKLQALGELTGGIAHDFNNLMTVIRGSAELLANDALPADKRRRYVEAIIETADRASTLTSHLLAFGRRQALRPEVIEPNLRLDALGEILSRTLGASIDIHLSLSPGLWSIEVDSAQLETALLNAAFNARDEMPKGGSLTLSTRNHIDTELGECVCIDVTDTGDGMESEIASRAFEPFFTTKPIGKGTGLGLSQIHGFAAQSGGRATISSAPGEGTSVSLILPRTLKVSRAPVERSDVAPTACGKTVLLVEDNDQVRSFAEALLKEIGCRVVAAESAEVALPLLQSSPPDLLFSDIVMPGRSGIALARAARELCPDLPVLLASGYSEEIIGTSAPDFDMLRKPYSSHSLANALSNALAGSLQRQDRS
ncbi:hybrid sensor histidine kinase/response regulator [Sphingomonas colocasiae]|uniref:histidine kinase n=1 Tax=Sphingomonas colocasiae TaxID=1848973 RepID=A0ABS7PJJ1_9SPHN|nr:PAS domain-containing sensor histidine kinase [Sphingomonas colocasiae]MBY8821456.1 PAS domain S-box protein [Sphingomonas colocasiae]